MVKSNKKILIVLFWVLFSLMKVSLQAEEICLKNAWNAFNKENYEQAIKYADKCIDEFGKQAAKIQKNLELKHIPEPPTGKVSSPEKHKIFERGLLNDVATAYWIKGRSAEFLYKKTKNLKYKRIAEEAYKTVCKKYKYGRPWDPRGWFWSPCEAASTRLPIE